MLIAIAVAGVTRSEMMLKGQSYQPYSEGKVSKEKVDKALAKARSQRKFLMVEFGANWCEDCVVLAQTLEKGDTKKYFKSHFEVLRVDVGRFDRNLEIAKTLGVEMTAIPTAVFYAPDGERVGATNKGELEPARKYGSKQIYEFLKDIAERRMITNPATKS
jgi:protein disulfide-isomerase